jgi:LAO/AO transport system kinase
MNEAAAILAGDRRALARGLTLVESGGARGAELLDALCPRTGRARRIGVTGPPGAGKSTLVAALVRSLRPSGKLVGVVAVDPTSPFSGGALLGDRHRMSEEAKDAGVFVRSLASRGAVGGLSRAAQDSMDLLDAAGFDVVIVETVGVGQTELDVAAAADTVVVVLSPESGDAVQAMKAGLLEISDVLCVNKADREGADALVAALESALDLRAEAPWRPPVVSTKALEGAGPLLDALARHEEWLGAEERLALRRRAAAAARIRALFGLLLAERFLRRAEPILGREAQEVADRRRTAFRAAERAVEETLR